MTLPIRKRPELRDSGRSRTLRKVRAAGAALGLRMPHLQDQTRPTRRRGGRHIDRERDSVLIYRFPGKIEAATLRLGRRRITLWENHGSCEGDREPRVILDSTAKMAGRFANEVWNQPTQRGCWAALAPLGRPIGREMPVFRRIRPGRRQCIKISGVAGVQAPAFVERPGLVAESQGRRIVSPEFRLRPSLSAARLGRLGRLAHVSPEFRLRPSLSERHRHGQPVGGGRVAGVQAPAFVERTRTTAAAASRACVAGVQAPAFVERRHERVDCDVERPPIGVLHDAPRFSTLDGSARTATAMRRKEHANIDPSTGRR